MLLPLSSASYASFFVCTWILKYRVQRNGEPFFGNRSGPLSDQQPELQIQVTAVDVQPPAPITHTQTHNGIYTAELTDRLHRRPQRGQANRTEEEHSKTQKSSRRRQKRQSSNLYGQIRCRSKSLYSAGRLPFWPPDRVQHFWPIVWRGASRGCRG